MSNQLSDQSREPTVSELLALINAFCSASEEARKQVIKLCEDAVANQK